MTNTQIDSLQAYGAGNMETVMKVFGTASSGLQTLATELADYNKNSVERGAAAFQDLTRAKSLGEAMQIQSDYLRTTYETLSTEMNKIGEIWLSMAGAGASAGAARKSRTG